MTTDFSIEAKEAFFTMPDVTGDVAGMSLTVSKGSYYAQIFKSKSSTIPRIFFMSYICENDSTIEWSDNLTIEVRKVIGDGSSQSFAPDLTTDALLYSVSGPFNKLETSDKENAPFSNALWYYVDVSETVVLDDYYALVFKSNIVDSPTSTKTPKLYYANTYRQDIFPIILASADLGVTWSNSLVPTSSSGKIRTGSICCGIIGKSLDADNSLDSGSMTVGGLNTSRRGYPVYLYTENVSSQNSSTLSVSFSQEPPDAEASGSSSETDQAMMRWYFYEPGILPLTGDPWLYKTIGARAQLDKDASFVVFVQPDRFPPVSTAYFPENSMNLIAGNVRTEYIGQGYADKNHVVVTSEGAIFDSSNNFDWDHWAHFSEKTAKVNIAGSTTRDPLASVNPSYVDFSLEKSGNEIEILSTINIDYATESTALRGFDRIVKYKNKYIAFSRFCDHANKLGVASTAYKIAVLSEDNLNNYSLANISITDTGASFGSAGDEDLMLGVNDTYLATLPNGKKALFVLFKCMPPSLTGRPWVNLCYVLESELDSFLLDTSNPLPFISMSIQSENQYDGAWSTFITPSDNEIVIKAYYERITADVACYTSSDYQFAKFLPSNSSTNIYFTVRNPVNNFGIWSINLANLVTASNATPDTISYATLVRSSAKGRGFDASVDKEVEISFVMQDGIDIYFGTCVYGNNFTDNAKSVSTKMGEVYKTSDYRTFAKVLDGNISQKFLQGFAGQTNFNENDKIVFMTKVDDILHVWVSKSDQRMIAVATTLTVGGVSGTYQVRAGTPLHIAIDLSKSLTKLLRVFPIMDTDFTDSDAFTIVSYPDSKMLSSFICGSTNGDNISICGRSMSVKGDIAGKTILWIMYDRRTINLPFIYYNDDSYDIKYFSNSGQNPLLMNPYKMIVINSKDPVPVPEKYGVYHGYTLAKYNYFKKDNLFNDYPALNITDDSPRVGIYCGIVSAGGSIGNIEFGADNPRLVTQSGITYMICDSADKKGFSVYKTYGVKQEYSKWGITDFTEFDLDGECWYRSTNENQFMGLSNYASVCQCGNLFFISPMKYNAEDSTIDGLSGIERFISVITTGMKSPQSISFYYKLNPLNKETWGSGIEQQFGNTTDSNTVMVLKSAGTLEGLFDSTNCKIINLAQKSITNDPEDFLWFHQTFPTDIQNCFYRLESKSLNVPTSLVYKNISGVVPDPYCEVLIKGLRFGDVDLGGADSATSDKKISISGIVHGSYLPEMGNYVYTDPADAVSKSDTGGALIPPGGEIIIDFPMPIYLSEISYKANFDGLKESSGSLSKFKFSCLPKLGKQSYGSKTSDGKTIDGIVSEDDWQDIGGPVVFDPNTDSVIKKDALSMYTGTVRISLESGVSLKINNLTVKSFADANASKFLSTGRVSNPELIVVDDIRGLIEGTVDGERGAAFASLNAEQASIVVDLGDPGEGYSGIPVDRISMNIFGADNTRTIAVDVWDGVTVTGTNSDKVWERLYTGYVVNYEYSIVKWSPELKQRSNQVNIGIISNEDLMDNTDEYNLIDDFFARNSSSINFSNYFDSGQLIGYGFKPNIYKDSSLSIVGSSSDTSDMQSNGKIYVNCQMDEDGPYSGDISQGIGILERNLNITFPLRTVKMIRVTVLNRGENSIRINGLRAYTPIVNDDGNSIWPKSLVTWNIKLNVIASSF